MYYCKQLSSQPFTCRGGLLAERHLKVNFLQAVVIYHTLQKKDSIFPMGCGKNVKWFLKTLPGNTSLYFLVPHHHS